jgi:copper chaperone CopZ
VPDVTCESCQRKIESVVRPSPGVESVSVDLAAKQVNVRFRPDRVDLAEVSAAIEARG